MVLSNASQTINVTILGVVYPFSRKFQRKQTTHEYESGSVSVYDQGRPESFLMIEIADDHDNHDDIRNFILNTANYSENVCKLSPDDDIDFGNGVGTSVNVRYWADNFVESMKKFQHYKYNMVFRVE